MASSRTGLLIFKIGAIFTNSLANPFPLCLNIPSPKAIVLFENLKKKSWTIVVYHVEMNSMCIVANGNYGHKFIVK